ncbi:MAG: ABC transporter permease, partial [Planctomycetota bacterium]|nr:ABC transporter permease [Planctomycetota bacterium]
IVKLFAEPSPPYAGVYIHQVNWTQLSNDILGIVEGRWGDKTPVYPRYWLSPRTDTSQGPLITTRSGENPIAMRGLLGLDPREINQRSDLQDAFGIDGEEIDSQVLMTSAVANKVAVEPGDEVIVGGLNLKVGPLLDPKDMLVLQDMDGSGVLPVDFVVMQSAIGDQDAAEESTEGLALQSEQNWAYLPADAVVVVSAANAKKLGGLLHGVILYTRDAREAVDLAEDMARTFPLPISATRQDGVYRHVLGTVVQASGAKDLLVPILLGGLVIFGTMLGSVADREREIYTFSSLGLAPPHVASLFFAEAMIYSVIGGLGGYLIAQISMQVLSYLADFGLVRVPEMNYSSTNAIVTILIVMATVLISAIYPAIKASKSANPGILRSWRLPTPEGDTFDIQFPFTVSDYDITGVVSFLKEHFDNYGDAGLGVFMARDARLAEGDGNSLGVDAHLSLAPFDLGVTQNFELRSTPSEIEGIDEVKIQLTRLSGQPKDWQRLNKVLLDDLRVQFLIWRSLPQETMELYRDRTLALMGENA